MQRLLIRVLTAAIAFQAAAAFAASGGGDITFTPKNSNRVVFSHDYHLKTIGIKCMACHVQKFSKTGSGYQMAREKITKSDFCRHCHNGLKGFDTQSDKNCIRCHTK